MHRHNAEAARSTPQTHHQGITHLHQKVDPLWPCQSTASFECGEKTDLPQNLDLLWPCQNTVYFELVACMSCASCQTPHHHRSSQRVDGHIDLTPSGGQPATARANPGSLCSARL